MHARANYPIRSAWIEFDPAPAGAAHEGDTAGGGYERLPMEFQAASARRDWLLELQPDRRTPRHSAYQLSFVAEGGHVSENPLLYPIEVQPDLGPEIEILTPEKDRTDVAENGAQKIELRALDPDFGLRDTPPDRVRRNRADQPTADGRCERKNGPGCRPLCLRAVQTGSGGGGRSRVLGCRRRQSHGAAIHRACTERAVHAQLPFPDRRRWPA